MAKKSKPAAAAVAVDSDVEIVSKPGMGIDEGIVFTTFLLLAIAITLVVIANKTYTG